MASCSFHKLWCKLKTAFLQELYFQWLQLQKLKSDQKYSLTLRYE